MKREWYQRFGLDREHAEALADFARGYLHEDVLAEHGSGVAAAAAFAKESSFREQSQVAVALDILALGAEDYPLARLARLFTRALRCSWTPASADELTAMAEAIRNQ